jgi:MFS family permease
MSVSDAAPRHDPYAALRIPDFRRLISARICLTVATRIQGLVVAWQIFKLTNDPLALGLIGLTEAIPSIAVSLYAGHLADSVRRKNIIVATVAVLVLCAAVLSFFASPLGQPLRNYSRAGNGWPTPLPGTAPRTRPRPCWGRRPAATSLRIWM